MRRRSRLATSRFEDAGGSQTATVSLNEKDETATLKVARAIPRGPATIHITYTGILNDKLRGFYLSKANGRNYAVSQMEATDARRAFPSFDEPAYKATFDVTLMIDAGDSAISNGRQVSDTPGPEPGKHTVVFARTPKMSSYLVALLVGDFVCRSGASGATPIRICATPDKLGLTAFALAAAEQQVAFFNKYFGIPYPYEKLDIIGVPDFAAGAMENAGAITFRERMLLANEATASAGVLKSVASVISHELAHQWFGEPGHDEVVGRHLAERRVRDVGRQQAAGGRGSPSGASTSTPPPKHRSRSAWTRCRRRARFAPPSTPRRRSTRSSIRSPMKRPPACSG